MAARAPEGPPSSPWTEPRRPRSGVRGRLHGVSLTRRLVTVVVLLVLTAYVLTIVALSMLLKDYLHDRTDAELVAAISSGDWYPADSLFRQPDVPTNYVIMTYAPPEYGVTRMITGPAYDDPGTWPDLPVLAWDDPRTELVPFTVDSVEGDEQWRVIAGRPETGQTLAIALPLGPVDNTLGEVVRISVVVSLGAAVAVAAIGWLLVRRAFRPLTRIEDTAASIAAGDLTQRVPEHPADDEVGSLSRSLNLMLGRIEQSFAVREASEARMRQFVADASHELRTPLATVRGYAELYRQGAVTESGDVAGVMRRIEDEATRMARLVDDMLILTRADEERSVVPVPLDLTVLAHEAVMDARARAPQRQLSVRPLTEDGHLGRVPVRGDEAAMRQVVTNLVANALLHTPADTPIEVAVGLTPDGENPGSGVGQAVLEVRDHGPGVSPEVADRVFERFFRVDPSRGRGAGGGSGLGLAIVAAVVGHHGGRVRLLPTPGGGATFRVDLPADPTPDVEDAENTD